jgi:hypothetical protein
MDSVTTGSGLDPEKKNANRRGIHRRLGIKRQARTGVVNPPEQTSRKSSLRKAPYKGDIFIFDAPTRV